MNTRQLPDVESVNWVLVGHKIQKLFNPFSFGNLKKLERGPKMVCKSFLLTKLLCKLCLKLTYKCDGMEEQNMEWLGFKAWM